MEDLEDALPLERGHPAYRRHPEPFSLALKLGVAAGVAVGAIVYVVAELVRDDWYQSAKLDQRPVLKQR